MRYVFEVCGKGYAERVDISISNPCEKVILILAVRELTYSAKAQNKNDFVSEWEGEIEWMGELGSD